MYSELRRLVAPVTELPHEAPDAGDAQGGPAIEVAPRPFDQAGLPEPLGQLVGGAVLVAPERQLGQRALRAARGVDRTRVAVELARARQLAQRLRERVAPHRPDHVDRVQLAFVAGPVGRAGHVEHTVDRSRQAPERRSVQPPVRSRDITLDGLGRQVRALRERRAQARSRTARRQRSRQRDELHELAVTRLDDPGAELPGDPGHEQSHQSALTNRA